MMPHDNITVLKVGRNLGTRSLDINMDHRKPTTKFRNASLNQAFIVKKDDFYTQYEDIAREFERHKNQLRGKRVLCNCDDPIESAFFRYFLTHFRDLRLAQLSSTCYAGSPLAGSEVPLRGITGAYKAIVTRVPSKPLVLSDGSLDATALFSLPGNSITPLAGDGDFRSSECESLLKDADLVATNPPFSLFREYIDQLSRHKKKFAILGNINAVTCKEVFPLFRENKVWFGETIRSGDRKFYVPNGYPLNAAGCGIDEKGRRYIRVKGVRWFTNLGKSRRQESIDLTCTYSQENYPRYDNYEAIEVNRTKSIPRDYTGVMGVPITFLDKYDPTQFEIIMLANGNSRTNVSRRTLKAVKYRPHAEDRGGVGIVDGARVYARILIRRKAS